MTIPDNQPEFPPGDVIVEYNFRIMRVRDVPSMLARKHWGYGHFNPYNRPVIEGDWPHTVDTCEFAIFTQGWWTRDETALFCPGCGLDCT